MSFSQSLWGEICPKNFRPGISWGRLAETSQAQTKHETQALPASLALLPRMVGRVLLSRIAASPCTPGACLLSQEPVDFYFDGRQPCSPSYLRYLPRHSFAPN